MGRTVMICCFQTCGSCHCEKCAPKPEAKPEEKEKPPDPPPWVAILLGVILIVVVAVLGDDSDATQPRAEAPALPRRVERRVEAPPPRAEATQLKVGPPYRVADTWYVPSLPSGSYEQEGIASWYGAGFNGRRTANGEIFDENALTAAHTTLPLPSNVRVTNLENGRSVVVRVNDRGPFAGDRIIGLSRAAARELGFERQGTARVRVSYLGTAASSASSAAPTVVPASVLLNNAQPPLPGAPDDPREARRDQRPTFFEPQPSRADSSAGAPTAGPRIASRPSTQQRESGGGDIYVQIGAFRDRQSAVALSTSRDVAYVGPSVVEPVSSRGGALHRVLVGPWRDMAEAQVARATLAREGYRDAFVTRLDQP